PFRNRRPSRHWPRFPPTYSIETAKPTAVSVSFPFQPSQSEVLLMLRSLCLATAIFVLPSGHASADAPTDLGANAALKNRQAFATLPKFSDAEQTKLMAEHLTMPLDAQARESVSKAEYALRMMHHGAMLPRCDWGIDWEADGIEVLLPQMTAARVLSSL